MKRVFIISLFALTLLAGRMTTACTETIDLRNDGMEPMLVINCILTDTIMERNRQFVDENRVIILKTARYFNDEFPQRVNGAKVWLNSELLRMVAPGTYAPEDGFSAIPGETYTLEVHYDADGDGIDEIYTATTTVPPKYRLDSTTIVPLPITREFSALLTLNFMDSLKYKYFAVKVDNENEVDFYSSRILRYGLFSFDSPSDNEDYRRMPILDPVFVIRHEMAYDKGDTYYIYAGDTLSVQLDVLSPEYYQFLEMAKMVLSHNNPLFSGPRSNIPANITGGALGVFGSYTFSRALVQIPIDTPGMPKRQ